MKNVAIRENHLYGKTYKKGKSYVGKLVAVYVLKDLAAARLAKANPEKKQINRLGLSVSKKIGTAVKRNRAKRIIRAGYSTIEKSLKKGYLIVISAKPGIVECKSQDIAKELKYAMKKLEMIEPSGN